jgi:hypothetical protein
VAERVATGKERPILFSSSMVRAILEGRKTQTRRVCKDQNDIEFFRQMENCEVWPPRWKGKRSEDYSGWVVKYKNLGLMLPRSCPYGQPDDRLYVRESFSFNYNGEPKAVWYWADGNPTWGDWTRPKPSIHLPRKWSRILLEIVAVRVERLQSMSHNDWRRDFAPSGAQIEKALTTFTGDFNRQNMAQEFWDSINAKRGFSWESNPWVWVIEFRRI